MTKSEKLAIIIRRDVESGFYYELEKQLKGPHSPYLTKLNGHPEFKKDVCDMLVRDQLPYYETVDDATVDAAYDFFMSPAGTQWFMLSAKFVNDINKMGPGWMKKIMEMLASLN
jgi:hypothetical protein